MSLLNFVREEYLTLNQHLKAFVLGKIIKADNFYIKATKKLLLLFSIIQIN